MNPLAAIARPTRCLRGALSAGGPVLAPLGVAAPRAPPRARPTPRRGYATSIEELPTVNAGPFEGTVYGGTYTVTLLPGDGIGSELTDSVKAIFKASGVPVEWEQYNVSGYADKQDRGLLEAALVSLRRNKVGLKGILFTPTARLGHVSFNVMLRRDLDIFASLSHIRNLEGFPTRHGGVDFAIIRENTEGEYSGLEHQVLLFLLRNASLWNSGRESRQPVPGVIESLKIVSRAKTERIAKFAFDFALKNGRKKVTAIHKANIMKLSDGLFLSVCREVAKQYENVGIKFSDMIVDNASMQMVAKPQQFDVVVCGNLYGNILSNIGAALVGGPGIIPGSNIGSQYAVFEPGCRHVGKDIEHQNVANPTAMILSACWMLRHLGLDEHANRISSALHKVIAQGAVRTPDLGGSAKTTEFTKAIVGAFA
ncbi:hypothetical protein DFJ74DRAFT_636274 [Hyaloraphidium curvatum]|nr:hypothetical protein DFJ74DRAFT_636274 [Hyaloraphidium curvatum]